MLSIELDSLSDQDGGFLSDRASVNMQILK